MLPLKMTWNPSTGLDLGFFTIHYYSLMFVIAFSLGWYLMKKVYKNEGVEEEKLDPLFIYSVFYFVYLSPATLGQRPSQIHVNFRNATFYIKICIYAHRSRALSK